MKNQREQLGVLTFLHDRLTSAGSAVPAELSSAAVTLLDAAQVGWDRSGYELVAEAMPHVGRLMTYTFRRRWATPLGHDLKPLVDALTLLPAADQRIARIGAMMNAASVHDYSSALGRARLAMRMPKDIATPGPDRASAGGTNSYDRLRLAIDQALAIGDVEAGWAMALGDHLPPADVTRRLVDATPTARLRALHEAELVRWTPEGVQRDGKPRTIRAFEGWRLAMLFAGVWWDQHNSEKDLLLTTLRAAMTSTDPYVRLPFFVGLRVCWTVEFSGDQKRIDACESMAEEVRDLLLEAPVSAGEWLLARTLGSLDMTRFNAKAGAKLVAGFDVAASQIRADSENFVSRNPCSHCHSQFLGPTHWTLPTSAWSTEQLAHAFHIDIEYVREIVLDAMQSKLRTEDLGARRSTMLRAVRAASRMSVIDSLLCLRPFLGALTLDLSDLERQSLADELARSCAEFAPSGGPWNVLAGR